MAESDSNPFQSADELSDEGENESQSKSRSKEEQSQPVEAPTSKDEDARELPGDVAADDKQDEVENPKDVNEEEKQSGDENMEQSQQENIEQQTTTPADSNTEAAAGNSEIKEVSKDDSSEPSDQKTVDKSDGEKAESDERTEEPQAPEAQSIEHVGDQDASKPATGSDDGGVGGGDGEAEQNAASGGGGGGWGSWGGWGSSLLTSATSKVSQMGHGLSHVLENVESHLGVPKPEDLPADVIEKTSEGIEVTKAESKKDSEEDAGDKDKGEGDETNNADEKPQSPLGGWFSYGASALTNVVEKTVTGGLDALELIGKKTMDVLQEGDPGWRKKRAYVSSKTGQTINLSEMLREAKEEAEEATKLEEEQREMEKVHFGILFDNYQGLAHLEALEIQSSESEMKVQSLLASLSGGEKLTAIQTELDEITDAFQLEDLESDELDESIDEQDFVNLITEHLFGVCVATTPDKLQKVQKSAHEWLAECQKSQGEGEKKDATDLHIKAIETLAELSARSIEQFHKSAELMLLHQDQDQQKSPIQRATSLSKLTSTLCAELSSLAGKFCERLNVIANNESTENASETVNPIITNIYLEASNSSSYVQDAFQLLLPVIQTLALENSMAETTAASESTS